MQNKLFRTAIAILLFATGVQAQNFQPINSGRLTHHLNKNNSLVYSLKVSIKSFNGSDSTFLSTSNYNSPGTFTPNWWGDSLIFNTNTGDATLFAKNQSYFLKCQAGIGDEWLFHSQGNGQDFYARVESIISEDILGSNELVKEISLHLKDNQGAIVNHPFNGKKMRIAEHSGFISSYYLGVFPNDTASYQLCGSGTTKGVVPILSFKEIFDFQVGDILIYKSSSSAEYYSGACIDSTIVLGRSDAPGSITYTFQKYSSCKTYEFGVLLDSNIHTSTYQRKFTSADNGEYTSLENYDYWTEVYYTVHKQIVNNCSQVRYIYKSIPDPMSGDSHSSVKGMGNIGSGSYGGDYHSISSYSSQLLRYNGIPVDLNCFQYTPPGQLISYYCGRTLSQLSEAIYIAPVPLATAYRILIENQEFGYKSIISSNSAMFRLSWATANPIKHACTYSIKVAAFVNGAWSAFGSPCSITTPPSQLIETHCGSTLSSLSEALYAYPVEGATAYRYLIENSSGAVIQVTGNNSGMLRLSWISAQPVKYGSRYNIKVAAMVNGTLSAYGPGCTITTPTRLTDIYCNAVLNESSDPVYAYPVEGATAYRFLIENTTLSYSAISNSNSPDGLFRPSWLSKPLIKGVTYQVKVAAFVDGNWSIFGPVCTLMVKIQDSKLSSVSCNANIPTLNTALYAESIPDADAYRFEIRKTSDNSLVNISSTTSNLLRLSWVSGIQFNTTYSIRVAVKISGVWGTYGTACTVTTPSGMTVEDEQQAFANEELNKSRVQEDVSLSESDEIRIFPNPASTMVHLLLPSESQISIFSADGKLLFDGQHQNLDLDVSQWSAGMYHCLIQAANGQRSFHKIVVR